MFFIIIFSVFFIVFFAGPFVYDKMMTPKLKQRRAQAEAEIAAAARPAALPSPEAPMSTQVPLGTWGRWDRLVRFKRMYQPSRRLTLRWSMRIAPWVMGCLLGAFFFDRLLMFIGRVGAIHDYLLSCLFFLGITFIVAIIWWSVRAISPARSFSNEYLQSLIDSDGFSCPKCELALEKTSGFDIWSCSKCKAQHDIDSLAQAIAKKVRISKDATPPWHSSVNLFGFSKRENADRISVTFVQMRLLCKVLLWLFIVLTLILMITFYDSRLAVICSFMMMAGAWFLLRGSRLSNEPYSRCAHCLHDVPRGVVLPKKCSECGQCWHLPGGLLHHRIEIRSLAYGGLTMLVLGFLLAGAGTYRDWQFGQSLQSPQNVSSSALIAHLELDSGGRRDADQFRALEAELHQRELTFQEATALANIYAERIEQRPSVWMPHPSVRYHGQWLLYALAAGKLDASVVDRLRRASPRISLYGAWIKGVSPKNVGSLLCIPEFPVTWVAAEVTIDGQSYDCQVVSTGAATRVCLDVPLIPRKSSYLVEVTAWCVASGFSVDDEDHCDPAYLKKNTLPGVWSVTSEARLETKQAPMLGLGDSHFVFNRPSAWSFGDGDDITIQMCPLFAEEVSKMVRAQSALGTAAQEPIVKVSNRGWYDAKIRVAASSGSAVLDQLVVEHLGCAEFEFRTSGSYYFQIDLDSLNPAVAEVTP